MAYLHIYILNFSLSLFRVAPFDDVFNGIVPTKKSSKINQKASKSNGSSSSRALLSGDGLSGSGSSRALLSSIGKQGAYIKEQSKKEQKREDPPPKNSENQILDFQAETPLTLQPDETFLDEQRSNRVG